MARFPAGWQWQVTVTPEPSGAAAESGIKHNQGAAAPFFSRLKPDSVKDRPSREITAATGSSDAPAAGTLMAAAAPHSLPTNHRPVVWARDLYLGSDGA